MGTGRAASSATDVVSTVHVQLVLRVVEFVPWPLVPASAPKTHTRLRFGDIPPGEWVYIGSTETGVCPPGVTTRPSEVTSLPPATGWVAGVLHGVLQIEGL